MDLSQIMLKDMRNNEHVIAVIRHHWFVLLRDVVGIGIVFLIPFIILPIMSVYFTQSGINAAQVGAVAGLLGSLWALVCWQFLFVRWTDYYYDIWIITNWRIVDIDQQGLFKRNVASILDLSHIQDIETDLNGIIGNILNFGSIEVQTAGTKNEFSFENVASPTRVERLIRDAQEEILRIQGHPHI